MQELGMIGIDLFSGAGGMSLGARMAGVDVQIAVECDENASNAYLLNHTPTLGMFNQDIREFVPPKLKRGNFPLVIFGGPPCQGFSTSNQRTRNKNNPNNWLFKEFVRIVGYYRPDWVIFENVKGITETENGVFLQLVIETFEDMGYTTKWEVMNSKDFGVPQHRARLFLIASLGHQKFDFPKGGKLSSPTVADAIGDLAPLDNGACEDWLPYPSSSPSGYAAKLRSKSHGCWDNLVTKNANNIIARYHHISQGGNWSEIPASLMKNYTDRTRCHTGIYHRLSESEPSVVIGNFRKNMLIHPHQHRGLSVREAARIQSFPDSFRFSGSIGFRQQQVGNAVPPFLATAVFASIIKASGGKNKG